MRLKKSKTTQAELPQINKRAKIMPIHQLVASAGDAPPSKLHQTQAMISNRLKLCHRVGLHFTQVSLSQIRSKFEGTLRKSQLPKSYFALRAA